MGGARGSEARTMIKAVSGQVNGRVTDKASEERWAVNAREDAQSLGILERHREGLNSGRWKAVVIAAVGLQALQSHASK